MIESRCTNGMKGILWVIVLSGIWCVDRAVGQDTISIDDNDACLNCIRLNLVASLGGDYDGPNLLTGTAYIARSRSGRTYVSDHGAGAAEMLVYAADGQLEYTVARQGEGPGEFLRPYPIAPLRDGRWVVFDGGNGRMTILDADGKYVQASRFPHSPRRVQDIGEGRLLMHGGIAEPNAIGFPFHVVALEGDVERSFGPEAGVVLPEGGVENWVIRTMPDMPDERFLAARASGYSVEMWDLEGAEGPSVVFVREADWFRAPTGGRASEGAARSASVRSIYYEDGLLWVLLHVPDPDWEEPEPGERIVQSSAVLDGAVDSVIEVLTLPEGRLIGRGEFGEAYSRFLDDGTVYRLSEDELGVPIWEIWEVQRVQGLGMR